MTHERAVLVSIEPTAEVLALVEDVWTAAERARKADPGDRSDVVRFESLATQLEHLAAGTGVTRLELSAVAVEDGLLVGKDESRWSQSVSPELRAAARSVMANGDVPVVVVGPFEAGRRESSGKTALPPEPPAMRWASDMTGKRAVEARFRAQIEEALESGSDGGGARAIAPSGVHNAVVTEILREFVAKAPDTRRVDVPVEYRDGSRSARPFPLRSLAMRAELVPAELDLRFALLSIRHTEMDAVVHGSWLRNAEVSRPRPAGQTDDFVYELSRKQLYELTGGGSRRVRIFMYQTGLETAVVGFYRAVVDHLLDFGGTVAVQPLYFQERPSRTPQNGAARQRRQSRGRSDTTTGRRSPPKVVTEHAPFREGTAWQM